MGKKVSITLFTNSTCSTQLTQLTKTKRECFVTRAVFLVGSILFPAFKIGAAVLTLQLRDDNHKC